MDLLVTCEAAEMYSSRLHAILKECIGDVTWTRSTRDEDNFRQVLCSALYKHIAPDNVQIPSTRSGGGDLVVFGRKLELKYASNEKPEHLARSVIRDFERLMEAKIEFSLLSVRLDPGPEDEFLHSVLHMPMLSTKNPKPGFGIRPIGNRPYMFISIFLSATYPHEVTPITPRDKQGKNSTAYISLEKAAAISRSSFLRTPVGLVHVDVIGSKEDGLLSFLFKRADCVTLAEKTTPPRDILIPGSDPLKISQLSLVDAFVYTKKEALKAVCTADPIEEGVPCFDLFWDNMPAVDLSANSDDDQAQSSSESKPVESDSTDHPALPVAAAAPLDSRQGAIASAPSHTAPASRPAP
jgi:hypothetical protein